MDMAEMIHDIFKRLHRLEELTNKMHADSGFFQNQTDERLRSMETNIKLVCDIVTTTREDMTEIKKSIDEKE